MFKKIISNLPFSPSLIKDLGFYAKRLRSEEATRRLGLIFVALALVVQSLAVFQPPQSANASSDADFIPGGVKSVAEILSAYDNNSRNFRFIMNRVGVTRDELTKLKYTSFTVDEKLTWGLTPVYSYDQGERSFSIFNDSSQVVARAYSRPLKLGTGCTKCTRTGWWSTSAKLGWFAIRESCGNLISVINPKPLTKCVYNPSIMAGDIRCLPCKYDASIWAESPLCVEPIIVTPPRCAYNPLILASHADCKPCPYYPSLWIYSLLCVKPVIVTPEKCIYNPNILADDKNCLPCPYNSSIWINNQLCVKPEDPDKCIYNPNILATDQTCLPCQYNSEIWMNSELCVPPVVEEPEKCPLNPNILANDETCVSCPGNDSIWINDESCKPNIVRSKIATNISKNSADASTITAEAGDQISYTLSIENIGLNTTQSIEINEQLSDVVEYATIIDSGGGAFDATTGVLSWPQITLAPNDKQTRTFVIKLPESIPETAQGSSNDTSFDCIMTNTFGNSIDIPVACPTPKIIEKVVTALPVTGPQENMLFSGIVLATVSYFYARSKLQGKEIRLIRRDFSSGTI